MALVTACLSGGRYRMEPAHRLCARPTGFGRKERQTELTRERILAVARELIATNGLFDTQMTDVAERANVSRTTLYRYFADKLDLALAELSRVTAEMLDRERLACTISRHSGIDRITEFIRSSWMSPEYAAHARYLAEFDAYFSGNRVPPDFVAKVAAAITRTHYPFLAELLREGMTDGSVRQDIDPHLTAVTMVNAIRGLQQRLLLRSSVLVELEPGEGDRMMDELLDYLIRGIQSGALQTNIEEGHAASVDFQYRLE